MRPLEWSQNKAGSLNGKVGHVTLFCLAYYLERGYFLAPKLPGLNKTIPVKSKKPAKGRQRYYINGILFLEGENGFKNPTTQGE